MFRLFYRRKPEELQGHRLFEQCVAVSRADEFYSEMNVPDSFDGRFEMLVVFSSMVMRRLNVIGSDAAKATAQALFDEMFANMDLSLREQGVGDLSVAKQIKRMIGGFYGRGESYDEALKARNMDAMTEALLRNVYGTVHPDVDCSGDAGKLVARIFIFEDMIEHVSEAVLMGQENGMLFEEQKVAA